MRVTTQTCALLAILSSTVGCSLFVNPDTDKLGATQDGATTPDGFVPPSDGGTDSMLPACANNCDDGIACTLDECVGEPRTCQHTPNHNACDADQRCDPIRGGCTGACVTDDECKDNNPCNGEETCNRDSGECVAGDAVQCAVRNMCWEGTCNPSNGECDYAPNDSLCQTNNLCQTGTCGSGGCTSQQTVCNDGSPCTRDFCDESQGCMTELIDADGDGQASDQLGACGTDCDDDDAARYQGATEYCDGIDSNCNGRSDSADQCVVLPDDCRDAEGALPMVAPGQTIVLWNGSLDLLNDDYDPPCFSNTGPDAAFEIRVNGTADVMIEAMAVSGNVDPKLMVVRDGTCGSSAFEASENEILCNEDASENEKNARIWVQDTTGFDLLMDSDDNDSGIMKLILTVMATKPQQCGAGLDITAGGTWIGHPAHDQDYEPGCSSNIDNPQGIARFSGPSDGDIDVVANDTFSESVLELSNDSCNTDLACDDSGTRSFSENVTPGATYHLVIEGDRTNGTFAVQFKP